MTLFANMAHATDAEFQVRITPIEAAPPIAEAWQPEHSDECTPEMRGNGMYAAGCERCARLVTEMYYRGRGVEAAPADEASTIERVARAISDRDYSAHETQWADLDEGERDVYRRLAVAAIESGALHTAARTLRKFAEWIVSLDDDDPQSPGRIDRQTVTLTRIVERARAALADGSPQRADEIATSAEHVVAEELIHLTEEQLGPYDRADDPAAMHQMVAAEQLLSEAHRHDTEKRRGEGV